MEKAAADFCPLGIERIEERETKPESAHWYVRCRSSADQEAKDRLCGGGVPSKI